MKAKAKPKSVEETIAQWMREDGWKRSFGRYWSGPESLGIGLDLTEAVLISITRRVQPLLGGK